jgi:hypothetical protein
MVIQTLEQETKYTKHYIVERGNKETKKEGDKKHKNRIIRMRNKREKKIKLDGQQKNHQKKKTKK